MATSITAYYKEELSGWNSSINFYLSEINDLGQQLEAVIRRDSIVGVARKVEAHQALLNDSAEKFYRLQSEILHQKDRLGEEEKIHNGHMVQELAEREQNEMRRTMQSVSKQYIDAKFNCYNFLSETFKKRLL